MGGNPFYSNAEAYALEILQQRLIKEAQKSMQQAAIELSALKTLFNQGQFIYCIPVRGAGPFNQVTPFPFGPALPTPFTPEPLFVPHDPPHYALPPPNPVPCPQPLPPSPPPPPPPPPPPSSHLPHPDTPSTHQSVLHVNLKNGQSRITKSGSDECNLGEAGIELIIDLKAYLPAEVSLDVDEKYVEIKACHVDAQGSKTFARRYDLPACIILDSVKCILSHDGYLLFSAAWLKME